MIHSLRSLLASLFKPASKGNQMPEKTPFLIVGLGNPGRQYRGNRHNAGFMLLDRLAERLEVNFSRLESKALVSKATYKGERLILAKPQTYMNLSGQAVGALQRFYKVPLDNLLAAYDDVDLPLGTIRLRPGGGSAGQKGTQSIIERLGTLDFPRLRLGVGRPPGRMSAADYVLQDFSAAEVDLLTPTLERAVDAILTFVTEGLETAMNQYNGTL
jgi:PTH1 family peptidyl-tRNA hydrolase